MPFMADRPEGSNPHDVVALARTALHSSISALDAVLVERAALHARGVDLVAIDRRVAHCEAAVKAAWETMARLERAPG
jgi:hypothetical protein